MEIKCFRLLQQILYSVLHLIFNVNSCISSSKFNKFNLTSIFTEGSDFKDIFFEAKRPNDFEELIKSLEKFTI